MTAFLVRMLAVLLVVALGSPAAVAQDSAGNAPDSMQTRLDRLRALIEQVEVSGREPTAFVLVMLQTSSANLRAVLQLAREAPEESDITEPQIREARTLFNRLSALLLRPSVQMLGQWLDLFESREAPVTRIELFPLNPAATCRAPAGPAAPSVAVNSSTQGPPAYFGLI